MAPLSGLVLSGLLLPAFVGTANSPNSNASAEHVASFFESHRDDQLAWPSSSILRGLQALLRCRSSLPPALALGCVGRGRCDGRDVDLRRGRCPQQDPACRRQALNALQNDAFYGLFAGIGVFLFANGLAVARTGVLPSWLGWIAIIFGIVAVIPAPIETVVILVLMGWVAVVGVLMFLCQGRSRPVTSARA